MHPGVHLLFLDKEEVNKIMEEVYAGVCGTHMNGRALARKIARLGYFWSTAMSTSENVDSVRSMQTYNICLPLSFTLLLHNDHSPHGG